MRRPLDLQERAFWRDSTIGLRNTGFAFVAREGVCNVEDVLHGLMKRHPVLSSRVKEDCYEPCCMERSHHIILTTHEHCDGDDLDVCKRELLAMLGTEFTGGAPLMSVKVLRGGRCWVVVFSHCLMDGSSRIVFARDVMALAKGEALSEPEPIGKGAVEVLELHLPSAIPPAVAGTAGPPLEAFHPIPFHGPKDAPQRLAIDVFAWDLQKSLERCRLFKVPWTMAFLTALAFTGCPDRLKTAVGCPLNSRQMVGLPVNELLNAGIPMGTMVERLDTFWTSAVATAASFKVNVGLLDFPRMVVNSYRTSMEAVPPGEPWPRRNPTEIQLPFIVSNMGPCSIPGVDILFGALGICHGGSVLIHVHTLGLKTFFSFSTMEPLYSVGRMKEIIVEALRLIENATE